MNKLVVLLIIFSLQFLTAQTKTYFVSDPAISPNSDFVVFEYEGDLWKVSAEGGTALRITGMEGEETNPVFSPDGKWIAFSGRVEGNSNIYILPVNGGQIKQLTFNDASDAAQSWSWDSQFVFFTSNRYNRSSAYKVSIDGGTPVRMFDNYFNRIFNFVPHPKTGEYFFNESYESYLSASRKRYKGDFNPDIKSYNPDTKEFKVYTDYIGKDMMPTIDRTGNVYFISDEFNDEYNLYTFAEGVKTRLTDFTTSILHPDISADGENIVFEKDYQIYIYNVNDKTSKNLNISLFDINTLPIAQKFKVSGEITNFNISPDNKKIVFVSRGELFVSDIEGKFIKQLKTNPEERVAEVMWLKDNKTILYNQTFKGYLNLFTIKADGSEPEKQITFENQSHQEIQVNDDRSKALYFRGRNDLMMLDIESMKNEVLVKDEFWSIYNTPAYFSPDEKYVLYTAYRDFEQDIFVYDFDQNKSFNITKTGVTETDPYWSPDGKYIYFLTDRYHPSYPRGGKDFDIYRIALTNSDKEFRVDKYSELFTDDEKKDDEDKDDEKEEKKEKEEKPVVKIDFEGINDRWEIVAAFEGNQNSPHVIKKKDETTVLFTSKHDGPTTSIWKRVYKPFETDEFKKIEGANTNSIFLSQAKEKYYVLIDGNIYSLDLSGNKTKKISISYDFEKNLQEEFSQMFYETWANIEENFYDGDFHGVDWTKMKKRYQKYLPYLRSRDDLRGLLNNMLGELNSSHQGFGTRGDDEDIFYESKTAVTGILFNNEKPFVVERIVKESNVDKEGKDVKKGDKLIAVNGVEVDETKNRESYFTGASVPDEMILKFSRDGEMIEVKIHPQSRSKLDENFYDEWVGHNQKYVDEKSNKKIAYIHMKDMGETQLNNFIIEMTNETHYRDALILDLRYNRGGNVHDDVLQFLSQKPYTKWKYRGGEFAQQPNFAPAAKPIVLLINEVSLSDAEMTAAGFKELKLGTIIGTETYRWLIFTSSKSLVDGSYHRMPSWGCYTLEGENIELNGVSPDIYIKNNFKDRLENRDPQLDKAIEYILQKLN